MQSAYASIDSQIQTNTQQRNQSSIYGNGGSYAIHSESSAETIVNDSSSPIHSFQRVSTCQTIIAQILGN